MSLARNDKPPAATAGSPGTALFLPPPIPPRAHPSPRPATRPTSPPKPDRIPVQWSFESSYGIYGAAGGAVVPTHRGRGPRESAPPTGMGGWFVRRRERDKAKALARAKSVDATEVRAALPPAFDVPASPARPIRSPLRPPPPPEPHSHSPEPGPSHVSAPLPVIPASNAPTPRPSRASSPVQPPPQSFRPTSAHRPGSSAGFKPAKPTTRPRGTGSAPPPRPTDPVVAPDRPRRRPATSSGIPTTQSSGPSELFLGSSLGMYGIGSSSFLSLNGGSSASLAPVPGSIDAPRTPERRDPPPKRKPTRAELRQAERLRGFVLKGGKRHHPRPRDEAPYPRNYERKVLDHDVWEHTFARQLAGSGTYHAFATPPARVLDLGCGTGTWVLECARDWPAAHFVGLDLVPIQPDPAHLPPACAARVRWVHANFLERLPFPDGAFSFVHVRRVARGVPEDRWGALFEEVARVLEPGGALEVVEEDLFFPGSVYVGGSDDEGGEGDRPPTPPPGSDDDDDDDAPRFRTAHADPRDHSVLERAYADLHAARFINLTPLSVLQSALVQYFRDVRSHPAIQLSFPPPPGRAPKSPAPSPSSPPSTTTTSPTTPTPTPSLSLSLSPTALSPSPTPTPLSPSPSPTTPTPLLPRTQLLNPAQHYVTLDTTLHDSTAHALPNRAWHFDLGALNMHLSARVAEVLACAEEMWDVVRVGGGAGGKGQGEGEGEGGKGIGREEWEECLARYEMDMQDKVGLGAALTERLAWRVRATPRTPERKAFDEAVRRWERQQRRVRGETGGGGGGEGKKGVPLSRRIRAFVAWKAG